MIGFNLLQRRRGAVPASWLAAAALGATLAVAPAAAQDAENPNVIVDDSVLDGTPADAPAETGLDAAPAGIAAENGLLPPPAQPPVSRLVTSSSGTADGFSWPSEATPDTTFSAVPTTPIESTSLDGFGSPEDATATAPAAGDTFDVSADVAESSDATDAPGAQTAAMPPIDGMVRVPFEPGAVALQEPAKEQLSALVARLHGDYLLRVQVLAYAAGNEDQTTHARGVSLGRALAMRDYLTAEGIGLERMDIRALGNTAQEEPADRVDLIPLSQ
jgi:outer membrane protein OmpA-like peptidoglycan-associated protein